MACPHKSGSLARLPGKEYVNDARLVREELLACGNDLNPYHEKHPHRMPRTKVARFENQVRTYGGASVVIENFWAYLQKKPFDAELEKYRGKFAKLHYAKRIEGFAGIMNAITHQFQNEYLDELRTRQRSKAPREVEDDHFLCFWVFARHRHRDGGKTQFPSAADLVTLLSRMAQVAPAVFVRDIGRKPTYAEVFALLRHPQMLLFFVDLMSNDRNSIRPLMKQFESNPKTDLRDREGLYSPDWFEVHECEDARVLRLKPSVVEAYKQHYVKADKRRKKRRRKPPKVLSCPALYTGKFREQFEWTVDHLEQWFSPLPAP